MNKPVVTLPVEDEEAHAALVCEIIGNRVRTCVRRGRSVRLQTQTD